MTESDIGSTASISPFRRAMRARNVDEPHRSSTPLELFFDLCFVVGVAQAADRLHHAVLEGNQVSGIPSYLMVFFAIWWAWMNFTWFASAYDCDDVPYRIATFVQILGVLILAAGVPRAFDDRDFVVVTLGYAVMRISLVSQWVRAAHANAEGRKTALTYAFGISACMVGWGLLLVVPEAIRPAGFLVMVVAELTVPIWSERRSETPWHPRHISERFGLFTLIVLGESVLAATVAIQSAFDAHGSSVELAGAIAGAPLIVFSMWWMYFAKPADDFLHSNRVAFVWGYGHLVVFSSAAAVGAGLAVAVDHATGHHELAASAAGAAVTVPVALYWLSVWALHMRPRGNDVRKTVIVLATAALVMVCTALPQPVLLTGLVAVCSVAAATVLAARTANVGSERA